MSEELIELPESWLQTEVGSISTVVTGKTPSTSNEAFWNGEIPFITPAQIHPLGSILPPNKTLTNLGAEQGRIIPEKSILAVCIGTVGKIGLLDRPAVVNQKLNAMVPDRRISAKFLYYWAQYFLRPWIIANASATVNAAILNKSRLETAPVFLAPLNEQKRIVAKIEELRSKTQKAREALEAIPEMCDRFRQSVLAAAFRGDLTADWREENSDVEPAEVLLEKIGEELSKQKGKKVDDKLPDPFDIADSWKWVSLSEICRSITDGDHQPPPKSETGIPFLTISNISSGKFDFNNIRYVSDSYYEKIQEHRKAKKGDILYSVVGSYGIPVLVDFEDRFCFQRHIAILKPHSLIDSKYLLYALKADFVFNQATEVATGTTQLTVTLSGLRKIRIPLVPKVEQRLIVERLEKVLSGIDRIQQQYEVDKARLEKLDRAILAKAFRGELVPQDPNDEPASVLLDLIREERSKVSDRKSTKRKR